MFNRIDPRQSCRPGGSCLDSTATATSSRLHTSLSTTTTTTAPTTLPTSSSVASSNANSNAGPIAGGVIGGVVFLVLLVLAALLYLRARKRERTPPSSEFMNSIRAGAPPVLRLESGAQYSPALPEKGGAYIPCFPTIPPPFTPNSYYSSTPMLDMKFPNELMMTDIPSARPSVEKPLHPQRASTNESFVRPCTSIGSRRELWGSEVELSPMHQSLPNMDSMRLSSDESSPTQPLPLSHSPPPLHPLRRQPTN